MGAIPRSLLIAIRDSAVLAVIGFVACVSIIGWSMQRDIADFTQRHGYAYADFSWSQAVRPSVTWTVSVLAWTLVVWCASRARAGGRSAWVPGVLAGTVVAVRAAAALAPPDVRILAAIESWPGYVSPFTFAADGSMHAVLRHPAWAFPPLVIALLTAAGWLGSRAGRLPDDAASRHVTSSTRPGTALAAVVVGLPALGAVGGAVVATIAQDSDASMSGSDLALAVFWDVGIPMLTALAAAALLSGTGKLGALATVAAGWPLVMGPFLAWLGGGTDGLLGQAAGAAVAIAAVAMWRPAAMWGGEILAPARRRTDAADEDAACTSRPELSNAMPATQTPSDFAGGR